MPRHRKLRTPIELAAQLEAQQKLLDEKPNAPIEDDWDISMQGMVYQHQANISSSNALLDQLLRFHADKLFNKEQS